MAGVATVIWSVLDRSRLQYERLHPWLRLLLRYLLAGAMIQLRGHQGDSLADDRAAAPGRARSARIGDLFPNHLLWWTVGASPPFETFTGLAELLGGVLLLLPRTTLLGALICAANMLLVFLLNMCYDVPVKLPSLHLLVMAVILIAPDLRRLADVFFFNRRAEPLPGAAALPATVAQPDPARPPAPVRPVLRSSRGLELRRRADTNAVIRRGRRSTGSGRWRVSRATARRCRSTPSRTGGGWSSFLDARLAPGRADGRIEEDLRARPGHGKEDDEARAAVQATFSFRQPEKDVLVLDGQLEGRRVRAKLRKVPLIRRTT